MSQNPLFLSHARQLGIAVLLPAAIAVVAKLAAVTPTAIGKLAALSAPAAPAAPAAPQITMSTGLYPDFDPEITDYVVGAGEDDTVQVTVNAPRNTKVSIDGQPFRKLLFTTQVSNLNSGQRFSFTVNSREGSRTYHVRRLPADFPTWTTERPGTPQAEFYIFAPNLLNDNRHYAVVADNHGVPVWWFRRAYKPIDVKLLPNGNIAWLSFGNLPIIGEERTLSGNLVRNFQPGILPGTVIDNHEVLLLPNGNYIYAANINRAPVDLSPFGGPVNGIILDHVLVEFTPAGVPVWQWATSDHIPLTEVVPHWWQQYLVNPTVADPFHINSIEWDGSGFVLSMRHLDAILRVDRDTGAITWKLGGIARPESLSFVGDTFGNFGGQHDARILSDGTLTLHDNGTRYNRPPRAVQYELDLTARTATLLEQVSDTAATTSGCCGSSRKLSTGNWVTEWGQNPFVTELAPDSSLVFRMRFQGSFFSYRVQPVEPGTLSRSDLRNGMDAQFPR